MVSRQRSVTMKDVAAHAGVSAATVSRALSGGRAMSPEVQQRVQAAAAELGYQINLLGRALRQQKLNIVGLMVPDLENPFFAALAEQLARTLRASGYELLVSSAAGNPDVEEKGVQSFLGQQIHALVIIPCDEIASERTLRLAQQRVPVVQFDRRVPASDVPFVGCDNGAGMRLISDHVGEVNGDEAPVVYVGADLRSSSGRERLEGFQRAFPGALCLKGSFDVEWGHRAVADILNAGVDHGVIVAAADVVALGVISGLQAHGLRVPEDFRVVGFDGIGVTSFAIPGLTTVRQPVEQMNAAILELIDGATTSGEPQGSLLQPELVVGASSPGG